MKILFLTNVPSPYRTDFFNELGKQCELTVLFEKKKSDERGSNWDNYSINTFKGVFLKGLSTSTDTALCFDVIKYIKENSYDKIIVAGVSSLTSILAIEYMRLHNIQYYVEADGGISNTSNKLKTYIKKRLISNAKGYYSSSTQCDEYFLTYGADASKIIRYPFTSLYKKDILEKPLTVKQKQELRKKLNIVEDKVAISVGRFSYLNGYGKGYDVLFKIFEKLQKDIGLYIIADEPTDEFKKWKKDSKLDNIHFIPFQAKDKLYKYYQASDISILMSISEAWGLVVNESLANGVPVITTNKCVAGLELIKDNYNGWVVNVGEVEKTITLIEEYFNNKNERIFGGNCIEIIKEYTIEEMARCHIKEYENNN